MSIDHKCLPFFERGNGWVCSICHHPCEARAESTQRPSVAGSEEIEQFLIRLGMPHIKTAFLGDDKPTPGQVAREIGSAIMQCHLGLMTEESPPITDHAGEEDTKPELEECAVCKGNGWYAGYADDKNGNRTNDPVQIQCPYCYATGKTDKPKQVFSREFHRELLALLDSPGMRDELLEQGIEGYASAKRCGAAPDGCIGGAMDFIITTIKKRVGL